MHDVVDLRSDTLTLPTPEMREAMARAEVGDYVWEEDPTVKRLEAMAAGRMGKEAGLFVTSGTQGNLVSVLAQARPGDEVVLDLDAHIFNYEVGGAAVIGGVQMRPVPTARGFLTPAQVREALRPPNIHVPPTGLVCVENTHNRHGGTLCTPEELAEVAAGYADAEICDHFHAYKDRIVLLEWFDAWKAPIYMSKEIPEAQVVYTIVGGKVKYRKGKE